MGNGCHKKKKEWNGFKEWRKWRATNKSRDCLEQGHFARDCQALRCQSCEKTWTRCTCESEEEGNVEMEMEVQEHMEESSDDRKEDEIQEMNGTTEDLHKQEKEVRTGREDNGDKETGVYTTETETQQTTDNNGQIKEKECATASETADSRHKEEVSDEEADETNFEFESRTLDSMNRRRKMKKVAQINIEQVLKKQKLRREAKARLKDDRIDLKL
ncbi:titin homolog [Sinocyclocheilus anshuiensis]|uniref:titin homolog n=1 Tax=Sinocyclocheilus anshuiensis TaxID=1608454 RepID=UPI0007B8A7EF|nr:PREDICTED: titin homolog [Sinocyclocheilus anshuiensis]